MSEKPKGYEKIYVDLAGKARPLGLEIGPDGTVQVRTFGRDYLADERGARPADGQAAEVNHLSL